MKVALVTSAYPVEGNTIRGGVSGVCYYLVSELTRQPDVKVSVLVLGAGPSHVEVMTRSECDIHFVLSSKARTIRKGIEGGQVETKARELGCDLIHSQGNAGILRDCTLPTLLTVHGINERDTLYRHPSLSGRARAWWISRTEGRYRKEVPNVIVISPYLLPFLSSSQKIWEIRNPVDNQFFVLPRTPKEGSVLFAGVVAPIKNVHTLIQGFGQFRKSHGFGQLVIAGETNRYPGYTQACKALISELGMTQCVDFMGSLDLLELQMELSQSQVLALCSHHEVAPLVISEAMAAAVPVLASNVSGIPYMLEDGVTGRLVNPDSPDSIVQGLEQLLMRDNLEMMSRNARASAEKWSRGNVVAESTKAVYAEILGHKQ